MSVAAEAKGPTSSRPFSFRRHLGLALLLAVAAPLLFAFAWQEGIATFNDDSFSYLTLARHFGGHDPELSRWAWQHGHFPPLFPLVLLATGGSHDFAVAHLVVAAFAVLGLAFVYRFASGALESERAGLAVAVAFMLTPTAWISIKGILSEPMYLALTFAALSWHGSRLRSPGAPAREWLAFGLLLAAAYLTRTAAISLLAAYALHAAVRFARRERPAAPLLLPLLPVALLAPLWWLLRPGSGDAYGSQAAGMAAQWLAEPWRALGTAAGFMAEGWIASFQSETGTTLLPTVVFGVLGALAVAGAVRRAWMNRLDGWYALLTLAMLFFWLFSHDTQRRLLYPLVPLLLIHAADMARVLCRRAGLHRHGGYLVSGAAALVLLFCLPAVALVAQKAIHREPLPGTHVAYADVTEYYRYVNEVRARQEAGPHVAALIGFASLTQVTPPGARIMWTRPEYVALLAQRVAVPYEYRWEALHFAREAKRERVDYLVLSGIFKLDVNLELKSPGAALRHAWDFAHEVLEIRLPGSGTAQFVVMKIDPERLDAYIAAGQRDGHVR
jgi:hypothetical protein